MTLDELESEPLFKRIVESTPALEPEPDGTPVDVRRLALALYTLRQRLLNLEANCDFAADQGGPVGYIIPARLKTATADEWAKFGQSALAVAQSIGDQGFSYKARTVAQEVALHCALLAVAQELRGDPDVIPAGVPIYHDFDFDDLVFDVRLAAGFALDDADTFEHFDPMLDGSGPPLSEWFTTFGGA